MHNKIKKGVALLLAIFMCSLMWMHVNAEVVNEKTFTVTTRPVDNQSAEETTVGQYDTFHDAIEACKQGNLSIQYIVTMNKDYTIPASEEVWYIQNANILLCSKEGQQYTLKRTGQRSLATIYQNCDFRTENIILDGNNEAEAFFVPYGVLTLGKGTIFQHFSNYIASDGPAIYVTNTGTVNIMEGAIIRNNKSDLKSAAVLQLNNPESTVNVYGGEFYNNNSTYWGGVFLSWGKINIMGGTFKDNYAQATGGVIASYGGVVNITGGNFANNLSAETGGVILFKGEDLNISNAAFTENSANKHGGAIYMKAGKLAIRDSVFTKNSSEHGGGALLVHYDNSNKLEVVSSRFEENSASFGGGIYLMSGSKLNVEGTQFINNDTGHGAAIATLPSLDVAADPSQLTVMNSQFQENVAWSGAGIFTSFPTKIEGCLFKANEALVADGDDQLNPHKTGTGGALSIMNNITQISKSDFVENKAYDSGGAICINGYTWNDDGTVEVKEHIGAEIKNNTKFLANSVEVGQGGAIYVAPYEYAYRIKDTEAYKNLKTDETTYFNGNKSGEGLFNPATNCGDFANLQFSENSDVTHEILTRKSLLNNYDVNYKNDYRILTFNANGGHFPDNTEIKREEHEVGKEIQILAAPTKEGYSFDYWKGSQYYPGDTYTVTENHEFVAQWKNEPPILEVKDATITAGDSLDLKSLITKAEDKEDGSNRNAFVVIEAGDFDLAKVGDYQIRFSLTDKAGASVTKFATVTVVAKETTTTTTTSGPTNKPSTQPKTEPSSTLTDKPTEKPTTEGSIPGETQKPSTKPTDKVTQTGESVAPYILSVVLLGVAVVTVAIRKKAKED